MTERQTNGTHPDSTRKLASAAEQVADIVNARRRGVTRAAAEAEVMRIVASERFELTDQTVEIESRKMGERIRNESPISKMNA